MDLVVVESPTKAKSIEKYLGEGYKVLASGGHVRDLIEDDGAVDPSNDFEMKWRKLDNKKEYLGKITQAVRDASRVVLATDPDREGEAISWHLLAVLEDAGLVKRKPVERVVFNEVTKRAVLDAMGNARQLDPDLIDAYKARRALDYLVGFRLSPVLWRKLPGSRSAGRVQSVALRLICEREAEIEVFRPREYWTVEALLKTESGEAFTARLAGLDGKRLDKFGLPDEASAKRAVAAVAGPQLAVREVEKKQVQRSPAPPFSTSTLQQEASRKLGFSAKQTMQAAQKLFEGVNIGGEPVGLITYMRTDSVSLSGEAIDAARRLVGERFGGRYLPEKPRQFKTKSKNAQEAHEAIRPTDVFRTPADVAPYLEAGDRRLYELIWRRTLASQMAAALLDRVAADIGDEAGTVALRATGQTVAFDGFLKLYREDRDDRPADGAEDEDDDNRILPPLAKSDPLRREKVTPAQHFTEPPPRFTEASLVKRLEELGIGRPSTYATIISVLQDREYVRLEQKRFVPEDKGRLVTAFLVSFFDRWVQPGFTAELEGKLDDVAAGELAWKAVLREFWDPFKDRIDEAMELRFAAVIDELNRILAPTLFPPRADDGDPRACPACASGALSLKLGRSGAFIGCSNYPECRYTRNIGAAVDEGVVLPKRLGVDPASGHDIWLKNGKYGPYLQRGSGDEVTFSSLPPGRKPPEVDFDLALRILALPREVGLDPNSGEPVAAVLNRYGAFVQSGSQRRKLDADDDVLTVGLNRALALLAEPAAKGREARAPAKGRDLGEDPGTGKPVRLLDGRYGPYVSSDGVNANLPKGLEPDSVTLERALELLEARRAKGPSPAKRGGKPAARRTSAAKATGAAAEGKAKPAAKASAKRRPAAPAAAKATPAEPQHPKPVMELRRRADVPAKRGP